MRKILLLSALLIIPFVHAWTQGGKDNRTSIPLIGEEAPSFTARSTDGVINFPADLGNDWKILFAHPKDFTPVCSSELLELALKQETFERLGAKIVVISTDKLEQHHTWKAALEEIRYKNHEPVKIRFPLVEDNQYRVANQYGMIHSAASISQNIRGAFIIDPENRVRAIFYYPNEVGRNIDELSRTLVALQTTRGNPKIVTPANWKAGDDYMVPVLTDAERENIGIPGSRIYQYSWFMTFLKPE